MTHALDPHASVLVVGAGVMGSGIAQLAARHGHPVFLLDTRPQAAAHAIEAIQTDLARLVERGKFTSNEGAALLERLHPLERLDEASEAQLVVEAIVEDLESKQALLAAVEKIVSADCLLTTNTSSISINAIANALSSPERLVGMHFFNPVPIMKLVEVISGLKTDPSVAAAVFQTAQSWGKTAVHARSTPGFIVNRIARAFYAETLMLLQEQFASSEDIDSCLRAAGFRMGPCELMDLIGHDINFAVTQSVFTENFFDRRFTPSIIQKELVDGGLFGRKSGRGFYSYPSQADPSSPSPLSPSANLTDTIGELTVHGTDPMAGRIADRLSEKGISFARHPESRWSGIRAGELDLRMTEGQAASEIAAQEGIRNVAVFDWAPADRDAGPLAWACAIQSDDESVKQAANLLRHIGFVPVQTKDYPGLMVARTLSMIVNEANDAVLQGVCSKEDANAAMRLGANYPAGPFDWQNEWGAAPITKVLDSLNDFYRGERYRVSPGLRQAAWREHVKH